MGFLLSDSTYKRFLNAVERIERLRFTGNVEVKGDSVYVRPGGGTPEPGKKTPLPAGNLFAVRLTQTGGSAGNATTPCSFSYTVKDISNTDTFGTAVSMTGYGHRIVNATHIAGTYGMAYWHTDGTIRLLWADERIDQTNCT